MSDRTQVSFEKDSAHGYLGNGQVLRAGVKVQFSEAELSEYLKCARDSVYFAENYCKVIHVDHGLVDFKLHEFQKEVFKTLTEQLRVIMVAPRQCGKCIDKDTKITVRNKKTGEIVEMTAGEFHLANKTSIASKH